LLAALQMSLHEFGCGHTHRRVSLTLFRDKATPPHMKK
jgi:hypothetical protein